VDDHAEWLAADAIDRRAALADATTMVTHFPGRRGDQPPEVTWFALADRAYACLRGRESLRITSIKIIPGTPYEGTPTMATTFDINDTQTLPFSLTGLDAKNVAEPLPAGYTATWTLADPDASGAVLTPSADGTTADLAAGVPDVNLLVSVSVSWTDASGNPQTGTGAEAIIVTAGPITAVGIVPGTPTP
jgi:hypothetical protein